MPWHPVLDGVLDRHEHAITVVQDLERGVEGRRLAGPGRSDGEHGAVRLPDRARESLLRLGAHSELAQAEPRPRAVEDPQHDLLAVRRRQHRDADVHRVALVADRHAAVLRRPPFGDVELRHDLQTACDRRLQASRDRPEGAHDAVDARADGQAPALRLEVEIGGALVDRPRDEGVDPVDRGCARRRLGDVIRGRRLVGPARVPHGEAGLVDAVDRRRDVGRRGHGEANVQAEREAEVVGGDDVGRVRNRDEERVVAHEADRDRRVASRVLLRQEVRDVGIDLRGAEVEILEAVLLGEESRDVARRYPAAGDDDLADPMAGDVLLGERLLELLRRQHALSYEERPERDARRRLRREPEGRSRGISRTSHGHLYRTRVLPP